MWAGMKRQKCEKEKSKPTREKKGAPRFSAPSFFKVPLQNVSTPGGVTAADEESG